jgi:hypothetical protein
MRNSASLARRPRLWLLSPVFALVLGIAGPLAAALDGAPVELGDDTLFGVRARVASLDPDFRAAVISDRIRTLARDLHLTYTRGFLESERVQIGEVIGDVVENMWWRRCGGEDVVEKSLFVTRLRTIKTFAPSRLSSSPSPIPRC